MGPELKKKSVNFLVLNHESCLWGIPSNVNIEKFLFNEKMELIN